MKEAAISLYRSILKLHRLLPEELKTLGDSYVRNEFRLHKGGQITNLQGATFLQEWRQYYEQLLGQVASDFKETEPERAVALGKKIGKSRLAQMSDDQLFALMELRKHASEADGEASIASGLKK